MNLYHFTPVTNVANIERVGLLPALTGDSVSMVGNGPPVVFLSEMPTANLSARELTILKSRGLANSIVTKRWLKSHAADPLAMFTVRLSSVDRKLKQYGLWLRSHRFDGGPDLDNPLLRRPLDMWWIYFGPIPPSKIVKCAAL
jgi:hypothetical protein